MKPLNYLGFKDEEMCIRVTPFMKNGKWTGDVHLAVDVFDTSPLDDTDYFSLMNLVQMMMSTPALMEQDTKYRDKLLKESGAQIDDILTLQKLQDMIDTTKDKALKYLYDQLRFLKLFLS